MWINRDREREGEQEREGDGEGGCGVGMKRDEGRARRVGGEEREEGQ